MFYSLLINLSKFFKIHSKFYALVASNENEAFFDALKASFMASFSGQTFERLQLVPALLRCNLRQVCRSVDISNLRRVDGAMELDLDAMRSDFPSEWILNFLELGKEGDLDSEAIVELLHGDGREPLVLDGGRERILLEGLAQLIGGEGADAAAEHAVFLPSYEQGGTRGRRRSEGGPLGFPSTGTEPSFRNSKCKLFAGSQVSFPSFFNTE